MKKFRIVLLLIFLFISYPSFAAFNTPVCKPETPGLLQWCEITITGTTTGTKCVKMQGYPKWFIVVDVGGAIQYDLLASLTENPSGYEADLLASQTSDLTGDSSFIHDLRAPYFCVNIDSCSSCTFKATIWGGS